MYSDSRVDYGGQEAWAETGRPVRSLSQSYMGERCQWPAGTSVERSEPTLKILRNVSTWWLTGYGGGGLWQRRRKGSEGVPFIEKGTNEGERLVWRKMTNSGLDILPWNQLEYPGGNRASGSELSKKVWATNTDLGVGIKRFLKSNSNWYMRD